MPFYAEVGTTTQFIGDCCDTTHPSSKVKWKQVLAVSFYLKVDISVFVSKPVDNHAMYRVPSNSELATKRTPKKEK